MAGESVAAARARRVMPGMPSITGKLELEYEGEASAGDAVVRELIRLGPWARVFNTYFRRR